MIRVLIVDDSPSVRMTLDRIFSADPDISVVGQAADGVEAVAAVERLNPDVITMDIQMPRMDGLEATSRIMELHPTPIVIVSGNLDEEEVASSFRAMAAGALVAVPKPGGAGYPEHEADCASLVRTVKLMAEVKVVRRWRRPAKGLPPPVAKLPAEGGIVAIGASTGGPVAINAIVSALPPDFPLPVLIVQHMAQGFIRGFADWLALSSRLPVHIATQGERILSGHAYIAPDGFHMLVNGAGTIALTRSDPENGQRPSVSTLFRSVAAVYGKDAVGILLTGMGADGARELKLMKEKGAVTIAQDRDSSIIHGMPGEAVKLGGATLVLPPDRIAEYLASRKV